jgi:hypothetical protein
MVTSDRSRHQHLGVPLVTEDKELVKKSHCAAVSMAQWLVLKA